MSKYLTIHRPALVVTGDARFCSLGLGFPTLKFGDECNNGHNTFSLTVEGKDFGGCCHDAIKETWPEFAHLIGWHLCSTDGPLHYIANTVYHADNGDLQFARNSAIANVATIGQLRDKDWLAARLPALLQNFELTMIETFAQLRN